MPEPCDIGAPCTRLQFSSGESMSTRWATVIAIRLRGESIAPFDRPVVPLVWKSQASVDGSVDWGVYRSAADHCEYDAVPTVSIGRSATDASWEAIFAEANTCTTFASSRICAISRGCSL